MHEFSVEIVDVKGGFEQGNSCPVAQLISIKWHDGVSNVCLCPSLTVHFSTSPAPMRSQVNTSICGQFLISLTEHLPTIKAGYLL